MSKEEQDLKDYEYWAKLWREGKINDSDFIDTLRESNLLNEDE